MKTLAIILRTIIRKHSDRATQLPENIGIMEIMR